ncbi:MAG: sterol desaturase family protein [Burkholderiales bacterium]|nr:sterol desaturase family protein [Burkholderiales bacterium]
MALMLFAAILFRPWLAKPTMHNSVMAAAVGFSLKGFVKFLPLLFALLAELLMASGRTLSFRRLLRWRKTDRIDLYAYVINSVHVAANMLNIVFSFGIAYFLNQLIMYYMPEKFSLFAIIATHIHYTAAALVFIFIISFFNYWEHRLWHTKLFWPIHRFHHSATDFNVLTNTRVHFTEHLLSPIFVTLPATLLGAPLEFIAGYLLFMQFQGFMIHINAEISYGRFGCYVWADPLFHKLHHSTAPEHINKNFSGMLPLWDHVFGTCVYEVRALQVGVNDGAHYEKLPWWRIYLHDFLEFLGNLKNILKKKPLLDPLPLQE